MSTVREHLAARWDEMLAEVTAMADANERIIEENQRILSATAVLNRPMSRIAYEDMT